MDKLELKYLAPYLPYELKGVSQHGTQYLLNTFSDMKGGGIESRTIDMWLSNGIRPILYPLSFLTKEIVHNCTTFIPVETFEIGDDESYGPEFDHGNVKLIEDLKTLATYDCHNDIHYLPYVVVQMLLEWHFDIYNLIGRGLAVDKTSIR